MENDSLMAETCPSCGAELHVGDWPFCSKSGHVPFSMNDLSIVDDSIPGGMTVEHLAETPMTFYSKSDWRREMKARGVINRVQHRPLPDSDKSPHTSRWI